MTTAITCGAGGRARERPAPDAAYPPDDQSGGHDQHVRKPGLPQHAGDDLDAENSNQGASECPTPDLRVPSAAEPTGPRSRPESPGPGGVSGMLSRRSTIESQRLKCATPAASFRC